MLRENLRRILEENNLTDIADQLENLVQELVEKHQPTLVILAGSLAKNRFVRGLSDIDILVVVDREVSEEERFQLKAIEDIDVEITVVNTKELEQALQQGNQYYRDALQNGVIVYTRNPHTTQV